MLLQFRSRMPWKSSCHVSVTVCWLATLASSFRCFSLSRSVLYIVLCLFVRAVIHVEPDMQLSCSSLHWHDTPMAIFQDSPCNPVPERLHSGFCWELRMMEVVVTTGAVGHEKLVRSSLPTTNTHPAVYRPGTFLLYNQTTDQRCQCTEGLPADIYKLPISR